MPIYEYRCLKCGHQFEKFQKISDTAASRCEKCGDRVTRVFHPVAIRFKGSGFYTTDYGKGSSQKKGGDKRSEESDKSGQESGGKSKKASGKPKRGAGGKSKKGSGRPKRRAGGKSKKGSGSKKKGRASSGKSRG